MTQHVSSNRRNQHVLLYVLIGFCLIFSASYTSRVIEKGQVQRDVTLWEERIQAAQARSLHLLQTRDEVQSTEYIGKVARDELRWTRPGDEVIVIVPDETLRKPVLLPTTDPIMIETVPGAKANWQRWLAIFTQGLWPEPQE